VEVRKKKHDLKERDLAGEEREHNTEKKELLQLLRLQSDLRFLKKAQ